MDEIEKHAEIGEEMQYSSEFTKEERTVKVQQE